MDEEARQEEVQSAEREVVQFSSDGAYYLVPRIGVEKFPQGGMIWLETATHPLPVGQEWHTPNLFGAAVMRERDYWRRFTRGRLLLGRAEVDRGRRRADTRLYRCGLVDAGS